MYYLILALFALSCLLVLRYIVAQFKDSFDWFSASFMPLYFWFPVDCYTFCFFYPTICLRNFFIE